MTKDNLLDMLKQFIDDEQELEMFITGPGGSGKTTLMMDIIKYLTFSKYNYKVVSFTHQACNVIADKMVETIGIEDMEDIEEPQTLHSWLKKSPGLNERAKNIKQLRFSRKHGTPEPIDILIVDEFSFIGEKDYFDIGELQDEFNLPVYCPRCHTNTSLDNYRPGDICPECEQSKLIPAIKPLKVIYVGDLNQLPPVGDQPAVLPHDPYWIKLTKVHRTSAPGLTRPLQQLVNIIEGKEEPAPILATSAFHRNVDIIAKYKECNTSKMLLAYTNQKVQWLNAQIQGYKEPKVGDKIHLFGIRETIQIAEIKSVKDYQLYQLYSMSFITLYKDMLLTGKTKYNPLRSIYSINSIDLKIVKDVKNRYFIIYFGLYNNKKVKEKLFNQLFEANRKGNDTKAKNVFKYLKTFEDFIHTADFTHAKTVHKSQGDECDTVFIDLKDIFRCKATTMMYKLAYVAVSRARKEVYCNS